MGSFSVACELMANVDENAAFRVAGELLSDNRGWC